jgi:hypothetical protein
VTAQLNLSQDQVSWSNFLWEGGVVDWEGGVGDPASIDLAPEGDGRIVFNRAGYEAMLTSAYERIAAMPYDELEHQGRRFLWPWQWGWRMPKTDNEE